MQNQESGEKRQGRHLSSVQDTEIQDMVQSAVLECTCTFWCYSCSEFEETVEDIYETMEWLLKMPLSPSPKKLDPFRLSERSMKGVLVALCKYATGEKTWVTRGVD